MLIGKKLNLVKFWSSNQWKSNDGYIGFHPIEKKWVYIADFQDENYQMNFIDLKRVKYFLTVIDQPVKFTFEWGTKCPNCNQFLDFDFLEEDEEGYCVYCEDEVFSIVEIKQLYDKKRELDGFIELSKMNQSESISKEGFDE
jgi:hypothetical protein